MNSLALALRLALAVIFMAAAAAKATDLRQTRDTLVAFGVPLPQTRSASVLLPAAEALAASALLPQATARWGAVMVLILLALFTAAVGRALSRGLTPDCNCFGQLSSEQIGPRMIARNALLAAAAALVVWRAPGSSPTAWTSDASAANLVALVAVLAASLFGILALRYRQLARTAPNAVSAFSADGPLDPYGVGAPAAAFTLPDLDGNDVSLDSLLARKRPVVLVFASPSCNPCQSLLPELSRWNVSLAESLTIAVIESGVPDDPGATEYLRTLGDLPTMTEPGFDTGISYGVDKTPTAVALSPSGNILIAKVAGAVGVEQLVRNALKQAPPATVPVG